jgi:opacity protein-like surface antigen
MRRLIGILTVGCLAAAAPAYAQAEKIVTINLGGGVTIPVTDLADTFGTGANFQFGVTFNLAPAFGIQAQYGYNRLGSKDIAANVGVTPHFSTSIPLTANTTLNDGDFNLIVQTPRKDHTFRPYGVVGVGIYHQNINLTTPSVGVGTVCDPWLLICYPTAVPVNQIVGERTSNDFGVNLGGGVNIAVGSGYIYAEARYIHAWGPTGILPGGQTVSANINYWPITFGFRF